VRRELSELGEAAERLRVAHAQRKGGRRGREERGRFNAEDREVENLLRLVDECLDNEREAQKSERERGSGGSSAHSSPSKKPPTWTEVVP